MKVALIYSDGSVNVFEIAGDDDDDRLFDRLDEHRGLLGTLTIDGGETPSEVAEILGLRLSEEPDGVKELRKRLRDTHKKYRRSVAHGDELTAALQRRNERIKELNARLVAATSRKTLRSRITALLGIDKKESN